MKVKDLNASPYNPRKITDSQLKMLGKSMKEYGDLSGVIFNVQTGNLIGGHQRLKHLDPEWEIMKEPSTDDIGTVAVGIIKTPFGDWYYREVDWPVEKEKAANIAANAHGGEFDIPRLKDLVLDLNKDDFDLDLLGFNHGDLKDMFGLNFGQEDPKDAEPHIDQDELNKIWGVKEGDVWAVGDHRILCGDATIKEDFTRLMGAEKAHLVFTDPPYNVDYGISKHPSHKFRKIKNDAMSDADWLEFNKAFIANITDYYSGGDLYMWGASGPAGMRQRLLLIDMGFHWSATIIWKKQHLILSPAKYQRIYEPCFYGWLEKSTFQAGRKQKEVWEFNRPADSKLHPTMKPVEVCIYGIDNSSNRGDLVLDPFLGSGSTMVACQNINRKCYGMEIDPGYCAVVMQRMKDAFPAIPIQKQESGG
jgi:DNA modification methylase